MRIGCEWIDEPVARRDGGSRTSDSLTWQYGYDNKNHLIHAQRETTDGGAIELAADYEYDFLGNRTEKSVDADRAAAGSAIVTRFAYDAWNPAKTGPVGTENSDVWADFNGSSLTTRYFRGDAIDQLIARIDGPTPRWYLTDEQGSINQVIDSTGVVKDAIQYDAWGNILSETNSAHRGRYAWTGCEVDAEIALQFNRARYYDATTGRWITQDPLGFDAGDSNLWRYVNNGMGQWAEGIQVAFRLNMRG